ncbi:MAG TPA: transporter associated domain-containing protein [Burkholderiales bacterium]|nr:transporter associated domain-containing protein [Burkholderiales bacterium]
MYTNIGWKREPGREYETGRTEGFTLNGTSSLQSLAYYYGVKVPVPDPAMSVADYLKRTCYGSPRVGDRTVWDRRVELMVQEMQQGMISKVSLRILPGWLPERRDPLPGEDAHNLMRRWSDHRPVHWGSPAG